jgi:nitroreductase
MSHPVLEAIRKRRSIVRFETTAIDDDKVQAILEAGRWAPSWHNKQPWRFIVVTDPAIKENLSGLAPTIYQAGVREAPVCIVVSVDPEEDPFHFVEDGSAATQNMALAAYSLGLGSCWIGSFSLKKGRGSTGERIKKALSIPGTHRVVSLLPIGFPKYFEEKDRKPLSELVFKDKFGASG